MSHRKQGLSQRHQRKIQTIRRAQRVSCSSEPLSPEDNYSSAASTPTTPCVNVVEETNDHHLHDTTDKSFKFPKFKKVGLARMYRRIKPPIHVSGLLYLIVKIVQPLRVR